MKTGTKLVLFFVCVVVIVISVRLGMKGDDKANNTNKQKETVITNMEKKINETTNNKTQNNVVENKVENEVNENNTTEEGKQEEKQDLGKEEQESNKANTEETNKQKAIELAKKEWAISVDSFNFEAEKQADGVYEVTVRNKTNGNANAKYVVDVNTGKVTEN